MSIMRPFGIGVLKRIVATLGTPGSDANIPTEKAVRAAIAAGGGGNVSGPSSATDGALAKFDGTTGKLLKNGVVIGTSAGNVVALDGSAKLPAVDGSQLTNLPSSSSSSVRDTTTTANVTIPTTASTVSVAIAGQAPASAVGQNVYITDGTYLFHGIVTAVGTLTITARALGFTGDTAATGVVASGAAVTIDDGQINTLWNYVASGDVASITTPALDATVAGDLEIEISARTSIADTRDAMNIRVNGAASSNYYRIYAYLGTSYGNSGGTDWNTLGWICGDTCATGVFGICQIIFPDYANANKTIHGLERSGQREYMHMSSIFYDVVGALSTISFTPNAGPNFKAGTAIAIRRKRYN